MRRLLTRILDRLRLFGSDVAARWGSNMQTSRRTSKSLHDFCSYITSRSWWPSRVRFKKWTMLTVGIVGSVASAIGIYAFCFPSPVEISEESVTDSIQPILDGLAQVARDLNELENVVRRINDPSLERYFRNGYRRIELEAEAGDSRAQAAIAAARESGDNSLLQSLLVAGADRLGAPIAASSPEFIERCREISAIAYLRGELKEARKRLNTILSLHADDLDATNRLGHVEFVEGHLGEAERAYQKVMAAGVERGDDIAIAVACGNLGLIYCTRGDLDRAEEMHRKALAIEEKLGRQDGMAAQYGNLGNIYFTRGDLERAEEMHRKSLAIEEKLGHHVGVASDFGNLGLIYQELADDDLAADKHSKSLAISEKLGRQEGMAAQYGNLGLIYRARGDLDRAEQMFHKSLVIDETLGRREGMANQCGNLGAICAKRGDVDRARDFWTKARDLYRRIGMKPEEEKVARSLRGLDQGE